MCRASSRGAQHLPNGSPTARQLRSWCPNTTWGAGGMTQIGDAISQLAGPAIAAKGLFVTAGLKAVGWRSMSPVISSPLATLLSVRSRPTRISSSDDVKGPFFREAAYGWSVIRRMPGLWGSLWSSRRQTSWSTSPSRPVYAVYSRNYYRR